MSMFNDIKWTRKETMKFVFRIQKKARCTRRDSRRDIGRSSVFETKRSGMELFLTHLKEKWVSAATQMVERFKETGHPVFKSISALSRGILKRKNNRDTIHFNADASNTELFFRTIHSANQLSIYGAVSTWCEEFGQILCSQEVNSLVCATRTEPASGKRLRECLQNLESRSKTSLHTKVC